MLITRRRMLSYLGLGAAAAAVPATLELLEPRKRIWQVPSTAPVGSRIERVGSTDVSFGEGDPFWFNEARMYQQSRMWMHEDAPDAALYAFRMHDGIEYGNQPPRTLAGRLQLEPPTEAEALDFWRRCTGGSEAEARAVLEQARAGEPLGFTAPLHLEHPIHTAIITGITAEARGGQTARRGDDTQT